MLFCSTELARRIERAECGLIEDGTAAIALRVGRGATFTRAVGGGLAAFSGADSPLTKVLGLGFEELEWAEIERIEAEFAARGASVQVELSSLGEPGIAERFTRRGYALVGFEDVLGRALDPIESWSARAGVVVARSGDEELATWVDVVVAGFAAPDVQGVAAPESFARESLERVIRDMAGMRAGVRYLARRAGEPAGGASMHVVDGIAQLCGAATLPAQRRRGVQGALLEHRLEEAARQGCDLAVVTTLPGSRSKENVQKQGFELLYTRAILRLGRA